MNNILRRLFRFREAQSNQAPGAAMPDDMAKAIVQGILATRADEISCEECFIELDRFAEIQLADATAEEALPLVEDHLKRCKDCREEFEMLMSILEATSV